MNRKLDIFLGFSLWLASVIAALLLCAIYVFSDPEPPRINLNGSTQFGPISSQGGRVLIDGSQWSATGAVQADGGLQLFWTEGTSGRTAIGVYDKALVGRWGWADEVELKADGSLVGTTQPETIIVTKERGPEL